ncbi:MAG: ketoacyl-ACP synthase III [Candidatus Thiodiazotropha sp.]
MNYAAITGWGKSLPPAVLTNDDLATFLDTDDAWIRKRTGMRERRISHVAVSELAHVAARRALAAAGKSAADVDLILFGTTTPDTICPNSASGLQKKLAAGNAACMDLNTACTSFLYSLTVATSMIRTGVVRNALVIGAEVISPLMDWENRNVAVLFGDGAAAFFLEMSEQPQGVVAESLGCYGEVRDILSLQGWGVKYANRGLMLGDVKWQFEGQEIFKRAVKGMADACRDVLEKSGLSVDEVDLVVPHQANLRIIEALTKRSGIPAGRVFVNIQRYANMSAATAPIALVEALEEGRVNVGDHILMPAFGGGLTWSAHLLKWGERIKPLAESDVELPPCDLSALELVEEIRRRKREQGFFVRTQ